MLHCPTCVGHQISALKWLKSPQGELGEQHGEGAGDFLTLGCNGTGEGPTAPSPPTQCHASGDTQPFRSAFTQRIPIVRTQLSHVPPGWAPPPKAGFPLPRVGFACPAVSVSAG